MFEGGTWDKKRKAAAQDVDSYIESVVPMNRFANPDEIANAIVFLASERSAFTNGACLVVDGGQSNCV